MWVKNRERKNNKGSIYVQGIMLGTYTNISSLILLIFFLFSQMEKTPSKEKAQDLNPGCLPQS